MSGSIVLGVIPVILLLVMLYAFMIRPWHLQWGATDDEAKGPLPGDSLLPRATVQVTHAIAIHASAKDVWPWLVQMGQGRGGFYSYTWLENLAGCQIKNAHRLVPEWQQLRVGDPVRLHPKHSVYAHVLEENRALVLANFPLSNEACVEGKEGADLVCFVWSFVLEQKSDQHTRLIVRVRVVPKLSSASSLWNLLFIEPAHFIMERKMLQGIKRRVERERGDH